jgi:hypothetical protein
VLESGLLDQHASLSARGPLSEPVPASLALRVAEARDAIARARAVKG